MLVCQYFCTHTHKTKVIWMRAGDALSTELSGYDFFSCLVSHWVRVYTRGFAKKRETNCKLQKGIRASLQIVEMWQSKGKQKQLPPLLLLRS